MKIKDSDMNNFVLSYIKTEKAEGKILENFGAFKSGTSLEVISEWFKSHDVDLEKKILEFKTSSRRDSIFYEPTWTISF